LMKSGIYKVFMPGLKRNMSSETLSFISALQNDVLVMKKEVKDESDFKMYVRKTALRYPEFKFAGKVK